MESSTVSSLAKIPLPSDLSKAVWELLSSTESESGTVVGPHLDSSIEVLPPNSERFDQLCQFAEDTRVEKNRFESLACSSDGDSVNGGVKNIRTHMFSAVYNTGGGNYLRVPHWDGESGVALYPAGSDSKYFIKGYPCMEMLNPHLQDEMKGVDTKSSFDKISGSLLTLDPNKPGQSEEVFDKLQHEKWSISLENAKLWRKFNEVGNEMIISKLGR